MRAAPSAHYSLRLDGVRPAGSSAFRRNGVVRSTTLSTSFHFRIAVATSVRNPRLDHTRRIPMSSFSCKALLIATVLAVLTIAAMPNRAFAQGAPAGYNCNSCMEQWLRGGNSRSSVVAHCIKIGWCAAAAAPVRQVPPPSRAAPSANMSCEQCIHSGMTVYLTSRAVQHAYCRKIGVCG